MKFSVSVLAEGDRPTTLEEIVELADAVAIHNGIASGALVRGIRAEDLASRRIFEGKLKDGSLAGFDDEEIAIGYRMAQKLKLKVGEIGRAHV